MRVSENGVDRRPSFARAFTSLSLASGVSMAANVVRGKLAALFLGAAGVGIFNQLSLMWNMFQIGGSLGAFNGLVQHGTEAMVSKDEAALHRLASTWWILLSAFSCMLAAAGAIGSPILSDWLLGDRGAHAGLVALMLLSIPFAVTAQVYRALLSAARLIPQLVRAQIISDAGGALLFAGLVPALGLPGAILGFSAIHFLFYIYTFLAVRKILGARYTRARPSEFRWTVVRSNIGFGAIALTTILLSNLSIILVSRFLIGHHGIEASGIFSNAWRIASVYLGAVTATAISYYLPTLTRAESVEQMGQHFNAAIRFYLYVLPPIMAVIMASGEPIVWLILSREFLPVAPLLLAFVTAELFRVLAETINVPLYSRRRLAAFLIPYCLQAVVFVFGAYAAIPRFGMIGAAVAYGVGTSLAALVNVIACRIHLGIGLDRHSLTAFGRALALLSAVILIALRWPFGLERLALTAVVTTLWACLTVLDPKAKAPLLATLNSAVRRTQ
jgi:O-antigen/teichoic acid export membrane protein